MHSQRMTFVKIICLILMIGTAPLAAQSRLNINSLIVSKNALVVSNTRVGVSTENPLVKFDVAANTLYDKLVYFKPTKISSGSTSQTINWPSSNHCILTKPGDVTVNLSFTAPAGPTRLTLLILHQGTGKIVFPATIKWPYGKVPTTSVTNGKADLIGLYYDGTKYYGVIDKGL